MMSLGYLLNSAALTALVLLRVVIIVGFSVIVIKAVLKNKDK